MEAKTVQTGGSAKGGQRGRAKGPKDKWKQNLAIQKLGAKLNFWWNPFGKVVGDFFHVLPAPHFNYG